MVIVSYESPFICITNISKQLTVVVIVNSFSIFQFLLDFLKRCKQRVAQKSHILL